MILSARCAAQVKRCLSVSKLKLIFVSSMFRPVSIDLYRSQENCEELVEKFLLRKGSE
jgi:hypothetical protein